jgi:hypothetical protein
MQLVRALIKHALLFYVFACIAIAIFMGFATKIQDQYWLAKMGVTAKGVVVEPRCQQHLAFSYQFEIAGATYRGLSISDQCDKIKSGDVVLVHYLPANPKVSTAANPHRALSNNIVFILMASLTGPVILLLIFWIRLRETTRNRDGVS